jgi:hypothetical protein
MEQEETVDLTNDNFKEFLNNNLEKLKKEGYLLVNVKPENIDFKKPKLPKTCNLINTHDMGKYEILSKTKVIFDPKDEQNNQYFENINKSAFSKNSKFDLNKIKNVLNLIRKINGVNKTQLFIGIVNITN